VDGVEKKLTSVAAPVCHPRNAQETKTMGRIGSYARVWNQGTVALAAALLGGCGSADEPAAPAASVTRENGGEPCSIATHGAAVYWSDRGDGTYGSGSIMKLADGEATAIADGQDFPTPLAVSDEGVAWATYRPVDAGNIFFAPHGSDVVFALPAHVDVVRGLALAGGRAYFTNTVSGQVKSVGLDGSEEVVLASDQIGVAPIAAVGTDLFWGTSSGLVRAGLDGGSTGVVWEGDSVTAIATDANGVYWITSHGDVMGAALDGSGIAVLFEADTSAEHALRGIAVDDQGIYFSDPIGGVVRMLPRGEVEATTLAGAGEPTAIAANASSVYWVDADARAVMSAAK
jgi:hypothetical protein